MDDTKLTEEDLVAALRGDVEDAVSFIDSDIAPERTRATNFYHARPFGDEEDGRSQIVMPVVRDTVRATLPPLMRIFYSGRRVVEFVGTNEQSAQLADEITETVNYVFNRQNPGFKIVHDAAKDALIRKVGWITWFWDDSIKVTAQVYTGVSQDELDALEGSLTDEEELEIIEATQVGETQPVPGHVGMDGSEIPAIEPLPIYSYKIRVVRKKKQGKVTVLNVPPEEVIVDRHARCIDSARLIGRRCFKTKGELVAEGVSPEILKNVEALTGSLDFNQERLARQPSGSVVGTQADTPDQEMVLVCDLFYRVDFDGDGISELRHIITVGDEYHVVSNEYANEVQLAALCPDPEPHVVFGLSQADSTMDLQILESHLTRDMFDSLKSSIFPRTAYVEGQVNADDVLNTEIGAAIRMRQPGMVQPIVTPFVGEQAMPIIEWLDTVRERRTGISKHAASIDAKALQSTNQLAVNAAVTGAQQQVELIARTFAETGLKRVFMGILRLLQQHQRQEFMVSIDGRPQKVDPRNWVVEGEFEVIVGVGNGYREEQAALIQLLLQQQSNALQILGPNNPIVSLQHIYNSQKRALQIAGIRDIQSFWSNPADYVEPPPEPPKPSPEEVIAQAQMAIEAGKLELEQLKAVLDDDFRRDELETETALKAAEIQSRWGAELDMAAVKAMIERDRLKQAAAQHADDVTLKAATASGKSETGGPNNAGRKLIRKAIRDASGRITAVEESEEPRKVVKVPIRDENGRIVAVEEREG